MSKKKQSTYTTTSTPLPTSLLIANRGEVARRIVRTAKRLGIRAIAVYSPADSDSLYVGEADVAYPLSGSESNQSYADAVQLLSILQTSGAEAVHPGYGFLSENADFAEAVKRAGKLFIGPAPETIRALGDKDKARAIAEKLSVPIVPGYHGEDQTDDFLTDRAKEIGYPVMLKAVAGGGGRGMRRVEREEDFFSALSAARREATALYSNPRLILEAAIDRARHIEVQLLGDRSGNVIHLLERECTIQRRFQKVIEEAPAVGISDTLRAELHRCAVAIGKEVQLVAAATAEFMVFRRDETGDGKDEIAFLEVNPRLQVEHPVTEEILGLDLVEWQIRVSAGETIPFAQDEIRANGHAVQVRVYAESPQNGFLPSIGRLVAFKLPTTAALRIEHSLASNTDITTNYDSLLAKLIVHAPARQEALRLMGEVLESANFAGVETNLGLLRCLIAHPRVLENSLFTRFLDQAIETADGRRDLGLALIGGQVSIPLAESHEARNAALAFYLTRFAACSNGSPLPGFTRPGYALGSGLAIFAHEESVDVHAFESGTAVTGRIRVLGLSFDQTHSRNGHARVFQVEIDGKPVLGISITRRNELPDGAWNDVDGDWFTIRCETPGDEFESHFGISDFGISDFGVVYGGKLSYVVQPSPSSSSATKRLEDSATTLSQRVVSPLPGTVLQILVKIGDRVARGQVVATLDSMKMEHQLCSQIDGEVISLTAAPGLSLRQHDVLMELRPSE